METIAARKKLEEPTALVISIERRGTRTLIVSIRGSTIGVLLALSLLGALAWLVVG